MATEVIFDQPTLCSRQHFPPSLCWPLISARKDLKALNDLGDMLEMLTS